MSLASSLQVCMDTDSTSDQHHHWLQATMHENALMDSSSSPTGTDMLGPSQILMSERRLRPPQDQALKCPRCDSTQTKFCYYNNYSLSQPRYFCKTCRRYWTKGGTLRNIPVGGGYRKNRKSSSSNKKLSSNEPLSVSPSIINNQSPNPSPNAMMMMSLANPVDLQLSFPFSQPPNSMMIAPGNIGGGSHDYTERESMLYNNSILMQETSSRLIRPIDLCMDYKQHVSEALAMNGNTSNSQNYNGGYLSTQLAEGYDVQNSGCYVDLGLRSYIDENTNNNNILNDDSGAQYQFADDYYSGLQEHHYNHKDIIQIHREPKRNPKMLALEWQQEAVGCPEANRISSKQEPRGGYDLRGSWWGSMSSGAGNIYQHQRLPSAATNNNSLH